MAKLFDPFMGVIFIETSKNHRPEVRSSLGTDEK